MSGKCDCPRAVELERQNMLLSQNNETLQKSADALRVDVERLHIVIRAKMDTITRLETEGKRAIEHIDDLNVIIADLKRKLEAKAASPLVVMPGVVDIQCERCGSRGPFKSHLPNVSKPVPREGCIQYRIRERQQELALQAHKYMMNGPAGLHFEIQGTDDLIKVVKVLLTASNLGKPLQVSIQGAV